MIEFKISIFSFAFFRLTFLSQNNCLACPICLPDLSFDKYSLKCVNSHTYNVSKKGTSFLLATGHFKMSKMYNHELFFNMRKFINALFYQLLCQYISNYLNKSFGYLEKVNILDLGCGEGFIIISILLLWC